MHLGETLTPAFALLAPGPIGVVSNGNKSKRGILMVVIRKEALEMQPFQLAADHIRLEDETAKIALCAPEASKARAAAKRMRDEADTEDAKAEEVERREVLYATRIQERTERIAAIVTAAM